MLAARVASVSSCRISAATSANSPRRMAAKFASALSKTAPAPSPYVLAAQVPVAALKAEEAFAKLTEQEALYAYHMNNANWAGYPIVLLQVSPEAPLIFSMLRLLFDDGVAALKTASLENGVTEAEFSEFLVYAATFFDNGGNYTSFGDAKFIPSIAPATFDTIVHSNTLSAEKRDALSGLWEKVHDKIYDLTERVRQLGLAPSDGITTYYSSNMTAEDCEFITKVYETLKFPQPYNTRVFKEVKDGKIHYTIKVASSNTSPLCYPTLELDGRSVAFKFGDFSDFMQKICKSLGESVKYAASGTQVAMLEQYIASFHTGSMQSHKAGSASWVKDKGPVVESYIGFIESYRDPAGTRGEWEGFVAVVNKATSAKFEKLVEQAPELLKLMPWPADFEKDVFRSPDFTSLEVLGYAGSGLPAGINIPNYDDIRQEVGFKNVSLGNVLSARDFKDRVTYLRDADQDVFRSRVNAAFELQVGLHELLGHGSGKIFSQGADGRLNFDVDKVKNPIDGSAITSWYNAGETWDTAFGSYASTIEECRAEAVGIVLCVHREVQGIFGFADPALADDIVYVNWLNMARAGLLGLQYYTPATKKWGQAHMQARFALLRVMLEAGQGFVEIAALDKVGDGVEGESGVHIRMDREKIMTVGVPAVANFLRTLQVYKSTAQAKPCISWYEGYTSVPDSWLPLRDLVVATRKPRQLMVQPILELSSAPLSNAGTVVPGESQGSVQMRVFDATVEGMIESVRARFPSLDLKILEAAAEEAHAHVLE